MDVEETPHPSFHLPDTRLGLSRNLFPSEGHYPLLSGERLGVMASDDARRPDARDRDPTLPRLAHAN